MSGGAGHVVDMNNRLRQNRSKKTSNKQKFKGNNRDLNYAQDESEKMNFKKVSEDELVQIKSEIKKNAEQERKREGLIVISIIFILVLVLVLFLS